MVLAGINVVGRSRIIVNYSIHINKIKIKMIDVNAIIVGAVGLVTTITSGWVSWLFARKKYNSEVDHNLI